MKRLLFLCLLGSALCNSLFGQDNLKYETIFFEDNTIETTQARFLITGAVSGNEFIKAKIKITNLTDKVLVVKPEECSYTTPKGELFSKDRWIIVAPRDQESKVIDVKGDDIKTDAPSLKINGFYICNRAETIVATDLPVPPLEELNYGNFKLKLDGFDQDGKEIVIKYRIYYFGEKIGLFTPANVVVKSPTGSEFKNQKEKDKIFTFKKKEGHLIGFSFISDSKNDNVLIWKDAFSEATPEKLVDFSVPLKIDLAKTKDKN